MPPSDSRAAPVRPPDTLVAIVAAASLSSTPASTSHTTSVIIGVSVSVGSTLLLVIVYRIWRCTRPSKAPLPPKGPLAHDRQRQRQMPAGYSQSDFQPPLHTTRPRASAPFMHDAPYGDHSRQTSSQTDVSSIPPSSPSVMSSQTHLVQTPSESDENGEVTRGRRPSFGSATSTVRHQRGHRSRTLSNVGSVRSTRSRLSSHGTIRGAPHHNHVDIVLPQPLAPGLYNNHNASRQSRTPHSHASSRDRRSESREKEYWSGRASMDGSSSSAHESAVHANLPHTYVEYPPPVPPLPAGYSAVSSVSASPNMSNTPSANIPNLSSPDTSRPLLTQLTPSPDNGPAPLPPPKDPQRRRSSRPRRPSESID